MSATAGLRMANATLNVKMGVAVARQLLTHPDPEVRRLAAAIVKAGG